MVTNQKTPFSIFAVLISILFLFSCNDEEEDKYDSHMPENEKYLMIRNVDSVSREVAQEYGATAGIIEILGSSDNRKVRPLFKINTTLDLNRSREFAFELVLKYRKAMTEKKEVQEFYQAKRSEYNLEKELFPLKLIAIRIDFYKNDCLCEEPYIAEVIFDGESFHYYATVSNSDSLNRVFKESYIDSLAYCNSQKHA